MKIALTLVVTMCLVIVSVTAAVLPAPWHLKYWYADGIAIGTMGATEGMVVDIEVEEWFRHDRPMPAPERIRTFRYKEPTCFPREEIYIPGTRFLLLMRKPFDEGAGKNRHWIIMWQHELTGLGLCLDDSYLLGQPPVKDCADHLSENALLDVMRSFKSCFQQKKSVTEPKSPWKVTCSDEDLEEWASRSTLHHDLATKSAGKRRRGPGGRLTNQ